MTLAECLDVWLARRRLQVQPRTWDDYRHTIACYIVPALGSKPVEALDPIELEQLYIDLRETADLTAAASPSAPSATSSWHR